MGRTSLWEVSWISPRKGPLGEGGRLVGCSGERVDAVGWADWALREERGKDGVVDGYERDCTVYVGDCVIAFRGWDSGTKVAASRMKSDS